MAENGRYRDSYNFIGISPYAADDFDASDEVEPLGIGDGVHVYFTSSGNRKLCMDMRSADLPVQEWDMTVDPAKTNPDVTLRWELPESAVHLTTVLVDITDNRFIDLSDVNEYAFRTGRAHRFKILAGEQGAVEQRISALKTELPRTFALYQNYPNPFNPHTTIKFDVAKSGNVKLQVYNVLGQLVATLADKYFETGRYDLQWNGIDSKGRAVSSGVYIVRLVTDGYVKARKMALVR